ncbi:MAG: penicillin-binding transpeptidase domain-containing protein, partial [Myxococcota bacterium]|nr:penicillin-binding transpeptidase domain-containing protein [Myxococcota bacterium]
MVLASRPRDLPHAARWIRNQTDRTDVRTTLHRDVQDLLDRTLDSQSNSLALQGIHNAAVVVVDHEQGALRALSGSLDFWDTAHGGQIVGFDEPRSPGSALKPFIYARAIDTGRVLPGFLVPDIPVSYGSYAPDNYDGNFEGLVSMESALSRSLNLPFVNLLSQVGVEPFLGLLERAGASHLVDEPGHYGLSAAIGGIELTPLEMAGLYAMLAQDGQARALRWDADEPGSGEVPVLSPGAAWLTRQTLSLRDRPDFPGRRAVSRGLARIHWKTGTSYGHRDAWAVGSNEQYTVAVWMGNFDNSPSPHLVGADAAGPVLFDLLEGLVSEEKVDHDPRTPDLVEVEVCALSGHLPAAACPHRSTALALESHVPTSSCPYHVQAELDLATGFRVT